MSGGSKSVDTSFDNKPTFDFKGSKEFATSLMNQSRGNLSADDAFRTQGMQFLSDLAAGKPINYRPSQQLEDRLSAIHASSNMALPEQLAGARSQYYRAPSGRAAMGIDDTVMRNQIMRDDMLSNALLGQYNADVGLMGNAANNMITSSSAGSGQAMQLLQLLTGEKGHGSQGSSSGSSLGQTLGGLGSLMTGVGALAAFSDRRLKTKIKSTGETWHDLPVYTFEYIFDLGRKVVGVMADEARELYPDAVLRLGEWDMVNYGAIRRYT